MESLHDSSAHVRLLDSMERDPLEQVYEQHRQGLFTFALAIARCTARAEDAVHEAFVRLWSGREDRVVGDPIAYAYAAVRRAAIDQLRRVRPAACERSIVERLDEPDRRLIARELEQELQRGLDELPEDQRVAIVLRIYSGLPFEAMAQALDAPLATVASRYRRGIERLRQRLDHRCGAWHDSP